MRNFRSQTESTVIMYRISSEMSVVKFMNNQAIELASQNKLDFIPGDLEQVGFNLVDRSVNCAKIGW
jgi:hypothetical protein